VRRFRLPAATWRNHALEHATVRFLRRRYGTRYTLSGHSEELGFRLAGARSPEDIRRAFAEAVREIRAGNTEVAVMRGCGTNLVTAQAIGLVLVAALTMIIVVLAPAPLHVAIALCVILALTALLRYPLGMRLQRRRMLLMDFRDASIRSIDPILKAGPLERHPVHFVRTQILLPEPPDTGPRPWRR